MYVLINGVGGTGIPVAVFARFDMGSKHGYADLIAVNTLRIVMPSGFAIINGALMALATFFFQILRYGNKNNCK